MFDATNTQRALVSAGYEIAVDGQLGPATMAALLARCGLNPVNRVPLANTLGFALSATLPTAEIDTPLRVRHFLAQAACETAAFSRLKESDGGNPHYFDRYEGNVNLGNTQEGDGARFCGRGLLDTTGRWNYTHLAKLTGLDCVNHPELLERPATAVVAAVKYWASRNCNAAADTNDIETVTREIDGGLNGLPDRQIFFKRLGVIQA